MESNAEPTQKPRVRARGEDYDRLLAAFNASERTPAECVEHLVSLGYRRTQARNAVYRFRQRHGLVKEK